MRRRGVTPFTSSNLSAFPPRPDLPLRPDDVSNVSLCPRLPLLRPVASRALDLGGARGASRRRTLVLGAFAMALAACTPKIGDDCKLSTDCSLSSSSNRLCDTSQPGGYCTEFNCTGNGCGDDAACTLFEAALPGCGYDDRNGSSGARTARAFCVATCESNGDCRDGYTCVDPRTAPWSALVLDDQQNVKTCMVIPPTSLDAGAPSSSSSAVCQATGPDVPPIQVTGPATSNDGGALPPLFPDGGLDAGDGG